jgi:hypothetical protein
MKYYLPAVTLVSAAILSTGVLAYGLNDATNDLNAAANTANAAQNTKNALEGKNIRFTDQERKEYNAYYKKHVQNKEHVTDYENEGKNKNHDNKGKDHQYSSLPPGLQKKVANGGSLPPGWQKKVDNGQVFSPELRHYSKRSPYPSPKGTSTYLLENKVIRVMDATNEIVDVLTN